MTHPTAATRDERLLTDRFPRSNRYHPDWVLEGASGGANALWLVEWPGYCTPDPLRSTPLAYAAKPLWREIG